MTDRDAFLAAIRVAPGEDLPRLVFADFLDENGSPVRASFIRDQIANQAATVDGTPPRVWADYDEPTLRRITNLPAFNSVLDDRNRRLTCTPIYRRGFVETIRCHWSVWLDFADAIRAAHPVTAVALTTWPNYFFSTGSEWIDRGEFPAMLWGSDGECIRKLSLRWPGITFTLPDLRENLERLTEAEGRAEVGPGDQEANRIRSLTESVRLGLVSVRQARAELGLPDLEDDS